MSEVKKKTADLDQNKMEEVKGGIPYEVPGLISMNESIAVTPPPDDPGDLPVVVVGPPDPGASCMEGFSNLGDGGCIPGQMNHGAGGCGHGDNNMEH